MCGVGSKPPLVAERRLVVCDIEKEPVQQCGECGALFIGAGFPIGSEGCWISNPNCGNCYGFVDGVYKGGE